MNNVTSISTMRRRRTTSRNIQSLQNDVKNAILNPDALDSGTVASHSVMLNDLSELAADVFVRKLAIVHEKEAARRNWTAREEELAAELEAAAYLAFRSGVPEEAIYELDCSPLSDALNAAIRKVQETA